MSDSANAQSLVCRCVMIVFSCLHVGCIPSLLSKLRPIRLGILHDLATFSNSQRKNRGLGRAPRASNPYFCVKLAKSCILWICLVLAVMIMGCQGRSPTGATSVQVMGVVSGQTIEISDFTGQTALNQQLRLIGISAPDWRQNPWGESARTSLSEKLLGQTVFLEEDIETVDDYDRHLAYVWLDDVLVNEWLAEEGLVMVNVRSPNLKYEQRLHHAQQTARILGRGIWNPENPMRLTPAEFRQQSVTH